MKKLSREDVKRLEAFMDAYEQGDVRTVRSILAKKPASVFASTLRKFVPSFKHSKRLTVRDRSFDWDAAAERLRAGASQRDVAAEFGVSQAAVFNVAKQMGLRNKDIAATRKLEVRK